MKCPACQGTRSRRSRRRSLADYLLGFFGVLPWQCTSCKARFHARAAPLRDYFYAHCPVCRNMDLNPAVMWRLRGPWADLARILRLRLLRCELCRKNFFSILPVRRG